MTPDEAIDKLVQNNIDKLEGYRAPNNFTHQVMQQVYRKYSGFSGSNISLRPAQIVLLVLGGLLMWATITALFWNAIDTSKMVNYVSQHVTPIISNLSVRYSLIGIALYLLLVRTLLLLPLLTKKKIVS